MNIYDKQAVERVWVRVRQEQKASQQRAEALEKALSSRREEAEETPAGQVPEEVLVGWISQAMGMERSYLAMARQRRDLASLLRRLARQEQETQRRLMALRFLLYGRKNPVISGAAEGARVFGAALRRCYIQENEAHREFLAAAERWPAQAEILHSMAARASNHSLSLEKIARSMAESKPRRSN